MPVHPSLGKELCILCWAVAEASPDDIPNALRNWEALAPEERWWIYTMTVATTGHRPCRKVSAGAKRSGPPLPTIPSSKAKGYRPRLGANCLVIPN